MVVNKIDDTLGFGREIQGRKSRMSDNEMAPDVVPKASVTAPTGGVADWWMSPPRWTGRRS
jgi:hypothetical protein